MIPREQYPQLMAERKCLHCRDPLGDEWRGYYTWKPDEPLVQVHEVCARKIFDALTLKEPQ